jgi:ankyrin repeat protein
MNFLDSIAMEFMNLNYCCNLDHSIFSNTEKDKPVRKTNSTVGGLDRRLPVNTRSAKPAFQNKKKLANFYARLLAAAQKDDTALLDSYIKSALYFIHVKDNSGNTALHLAARNGHSDIVESLCQVTVRKN